MEKDNFYQNRSHEIFHDCKCKTENFSRTFMRELGRKAMRDFMLSVQATFSRFNIHIWYFTGTAPIMVVPFILEFFT